MSQNKSIKTNSSASQNLQLYHYVKGSTSSQKVRLALVEKGLAWKSINIDLLTFENITPTYLAINPQGLLPVLLHQGKMIYESTIILEYLEEQFPSPALLPHDPYLRAQIRYYCKLQEQLHDPYLRKLSYTRRWKDSPLTDTKRQEIIAIAERHPITARRLFLLRAINGFTETELNEACEEVKRYLILLEKQLQTNSHDWLVGTTYSLADIAWTPVIHRLIGLELNYLWPANEFPALHAWWIKIKARASFQVAL